MLESLLHIGRRGKLIRYLKQKYKYDSEVVRAMSIVPRHIFVDIGLEHLAYEDRALPIAEKQTISQPSTVALQSHLLKVNKGDKILEIGTGCGYQTAVLAEMGARVYSIERQRTLYINAQKNLAKIGYDKPILVFGDGYKGLSQFAPFNGIIVTCGVESIPEELLTQLKVGGRMVIPVGIKDNSEMLVIERINENEFNKTTYGKCSFVPMLRGINK